MVRRFLNRISSIIQLRKTVQAAFVSALVLCFLAKPGISPIYAANIVGNEPNRLCDLVDIFGNAIGIVVAIAGIVLFVMLVLGGFKYLTSGGDPKGIEQARGTLTYAIAGVALLAIAWLILLFIKTFTGVEVTVFNIPCPPLPG